MTDLLANLFIGLSSLRANQFALSTSANNVANINTPGYSRRLAVLSELVQPSDIFGSTGAGVRVQGIRAARNLFLEFRLAQEAQSNGNLETLSRFLEQIAALFGQEPSSLVADAISKFFGSFSDLANDPSNLALRRQVLAAGSRLASTLSSLYLQLETMQRSIEVDIKDIVARANSLLESIAALNRQIGVASAGGQSADSLRDQRQVLLRELSGLLDINFFTAEDASLTISTAGGKLLVLGQDFNSLQLSPGASGFSSIFLEGRDITAEISNGKLGAALKVRDSFIPRNLADLDTLAFAIANSVNAQHSQGMDLNGNQGGDFFVPLAQSQGAGKSLAVALSDPAAIAAAAAGGGVGDNRNALALASLASDSTIAGLGGLTFVEFYSALVARIGTEARSASDELKVSNVIIEQLDTQRDAVSGVSLDEEAVSVLQYQQAYEAAARFISMIDRLISETLDILGGAVAR